MSAYQELKRAAAESRTMPEGPVRVRPQFAPEVAEERRKEKVRRNVESRRRANLVLAHRYPDEFAEILAEEVRALDEERGPLPGDPS